MIKDENIVVIIEMIIVASIRRELMVMMIGGISYCNEEIVRDINSATKW